MKKINISLSILEANFANLGSQLKEILNYGIDSIHFDIMDNNYVSNITFGPCIIKSLIKYGIKKEMHIHLMVKNVDSIIYNFYNVGINTILFHPETSKHILKTINIIKKKGFKVGIVLNPTTSLNILDYIFDEIDIILLMSVIPGFSNQKFIKKILNKIENTKNLINKNNKNISLFVDGGINNKNIKSIVDSGADTIIIGSYIFKNENYKYNIDLLLNIINKL